MKTQSLPPESKTRESLAEVVRQIIRIADPEAILLLSATYEHIFIDNIFINSPLWEFRGSSYDLLILTDGHTGKLWMEQEAVIRSCLPHLRNLSLQQKSIQEFNAKVESGEEYENFILLNAMISYSKGQIRTAFPTRFATSYF